MLTRTLLETKQEIPDFLQPYVPQGEAAANLKFETESDFDENEAGGVGGAGGGDGWGASNDGIDANDVGVAPGDGWGASAPQQEQQFNSGNSGW